MAIKSSTDITRIVKPEQAEEEIVSEISLRPRALAEYVGQEPMKKHLSVAIESAKIRKSPLEHILFYGPPGLGKTTISTVIAHEMGSPIKHTSGPAIEKQADIISLLTSLIEGEILFIDEIHRLRPQIEEILYSAMEDFQIDIMIGSGTGSTSVKMDIPKFTLIGATTKLSSLSNPLRDRFGNVMKLDFYNVGELAKIVRRSFQILSLDKVEDETITSIAERSRGTPRIANRYVKILRDYMTTGRAITSKKDCDAIFEGFGVDSAGLDTLDRKLLMHLRDTFFGRPTGLSTIASVIGEEVATIEDVVEPYLLQIGLIERTPRGRQITKKGEEYLLGN
ncbi:Holliday junction branch migration DNA helicase RuvB [Candidatus Gracilibacteria bacterium]|jgi:Holliday junction DNA helicase RuvB|nr:Holliday junction branch migration DNA helicase RuvB [Candidatus Gracilibacteria bacterium]